MILSLYFQPLQTRQYRSFISFAFSDPSSLLGPYRQYSSSLTSTVGVCFQIKYELEMEAGVKSLRWKVSKQKPSTQYQLKIGAMMCWLLGVHRGPCRLSVLLNILQHSEGLLRAGGFQCDDRSGLRSRGDSAPSHHGPGRCCPKALHSGNLPSLGRETWRRMLQTAFLRAFSGISRVRGTFQ